MLGAGNTLCARLCDAKVFMSNIRKMISLSQEGNLVEISKGEQKGDTRRGGHEITC